MWFYTHLVSRGEDLRIVFSSFSFALLPLVFFICIFLHMYLSTCRQLFLLNVFMHFILSLENCHACSLIPLTNSSLSYFSNDQCVLFFYFIWPSLSSVWNNCLMLTKNALNAKSIIQTLIFKQNPKVAFEAGPTWYLPYATEIIYCLLLFYCVLILFSTAWVWSATVSIATSKLIKPAGRVSFRDVAHGFVNADILNVLWGCLVFLSTLVAPK